MKKTYSAIDILKLFFAICVVGIHTNIMNNETSNIQWFILHGIFRLAVPFFFVCSGFFLGLKLYKTNSINEGIIEIKKYLKRLIVLLVVWLIIGLPYQIYTYRKYSVIVIIKKLIKKVFFYPWGALWYILAVIVALLIIIPFYKRGKIKHAMIIGGILYLFALICNNYYFVVESTVFQGFIDKYLKIFISARNGLFVGMYFVAAGMYIAELKSKRVNLDTWKHKTILVISYILLIIEIFMIKGKSYKDDHALFIIFIILIPEILIYFMRFKRNLNTVIMRNYSTGIYLIHSNVKNVINIILSKLGIIISSYGLFTIVLCTSITVLTVLYKINNKHINSVIK